MAFTTLKSYSCQRILVCTCVFIGTILFLSAASIWLSASGSARYQQLVEKLFGEELRLGLAEEVNGLVPEFSRKTRLFWNDSDYGPPLWRHEMSDAQKAELLERWHGLMPEKMGFVPVMNQERYNLPPPLRWDEFVRPKPAYFSYSMSVFHQIHCLDGILRSFLFDGSAKDDSSSSLLNTDRNHAFDDPHMFHCFDYLRQALMCCGDTALEGSDPYEILEGNDVFSYGTYGIGSTHICKDYRAMKDYADSFPPPGDL